MPLTEASYRLVEHEIAHAVLAHLMGFGVVFVRRDSRDGGQTCAVFRDDDPRSLKEMAFARAVFLIGAVDHEPGYVESEPLFCTDNDVTKAFSLAEAAGFTVEAASARARELRESEAFRRMHLRGVDLLLQKTHLDRRDLAKILR